MLLSQTKVGVIPSAAVGEVEDFRILIDNSKALFQPGGGGAHL